MMRVIPFAHHKLQKYPILSGMTDIRGDQETTRTIVAVGRKKSIWMTKTSRAVSDNDFPMDSKRGLLTNNNYRMAKVKTPTSMSSRRIQTPTHPSSRETLTIRPRRNLSHFLLIHIIQSRSFELAQNCILTRRP